MIAHRGTSLASLAASLALAFTPSEAVADCQTVSGKFSIDRISAACDPGFPRPRCWTGTLKGDLKGPYELRVVTDEDLELLSVGLHVDIGLGVFHTHEGDIFVEFARTYAIFGFPQFTDMVAVMEGSGEWSGAAGAITAMGTLDYPTGGSGEYEGEICTP
jgi:hypothetical protein